MSSQNSLYGIIVRRLADQFEAVLHDVAVLMDVSLQQEKLQQQADTPPDHDISRMLKEFYHFSKDYQTFVTRANLAYLENADKPNPQIPALYQQILAKVLREWLSLRPFIIQNLQNPALKDHIGQYLDLANEIARDCLRFDPLPSHRPRVYFQKTYSISRYAYSLRVPTISIPLDTWLDPWQWMGMAHEIGHYIYWNYGDFTESEGEQGFFRPKMERQLKEVFFKHLINLTSDWQQANQMLPLWYNWLEEIVADVYGALILGPAYIESLIAWLAPRCTADTLYDHDGDHPAPILRPFIQIEALRILNRRLSQSEESALIHDLQQLGQEWEYYCQLIVGNARLLDQKIVGLPAALVKDSVEKAAAAVVDVMESITKFNFAPYTDSTHSMVIKAAEEVATSGKAPSFSGGASLKLPVAWYAWTDAITRSQDISASIRAWVNFTPATFTTSAERAEAAERAFIKDFLREKRSLFAAKRHQEIEKFVRDVLGDNSPNLPIIRKVYTKKPDFLDALLTLFDESEFSTEEEGSSSGCTKCPFICGRFRRIKSDAPKCPYGCGYHVEYC